MDNKVVLLLSVIWIIQQKSVCVSQDITTDVSDVTEVTSSLNDFHEVNDTDVLKSNGTEDTTICDWSISGTKTLHISWSGNALPDSEVVISATATDTKACNIHTLSKTAKFSENFIDLSVCPNIQYDITIELECKTLQTSRTVWTPPESPKNVLIENLSNTSFVVKWDKPSGSGKIETYNVSVTDEGDFKVLQSITEEKILISNLKPWTAYHVSVAAKNVDFWGEYSDETNVKTKPGIPFVPKNLRPITVGNTSINLEWAEPSPFIGPILKYIVRCQNSQNPSATFEEYTHSNETDYKVKNLKPFTEYIFKVSATTEAGQGNWSEELILQTAVGIPHAPENLKNSSVTNTSVTLIWEKPQISTGPVLKYRVWRQNATVLREEEMTSNVTSYILKGLLPYVNYTFKVLAVTEAGSGAWSKEIIVQTDVGIPYPPRNLKWVSVKDTSVTLKWESPEKDTGPILKYVILWKNRTKEKQEDVPPDLLSYTVHGLMPFVEYTFKVLAESQAGPGPWSNEESVRTDIGIPHAPKNLNATYVTNTSIVLEWLDPDVYAGPILSHGIYWQNSSGVGWEYTLTNATKHKMENLTPFVNYTFSVLAATAAGESELSEEVEIQTDIGVPLAPSGLSTVKIDNTSVDIEWMEPNISRGPIVGYRVHVQALDVENKTISWEGDTNSTNTSYKLTNLIPYTNYIIKVLGLTSVGPGDWSKEIKFQTDVGVPHAVLNFVATRIGNTSIDLAWELPPVSTGPIQRYRVRWENSKGSGEEDTQTNSMKYTLQRLNPYDYYKLKLLAITKAGPGAWSKELTIQTKIGIPHAVQNFVATQIGNTSIAVAWEVPRISTGPILMYRVRWENSSGSGEEDTKSGNTNYTLQRLTPYVNYTLKSLAITEAGPGAWSKELYIRTQIGIPLPPTQLKTSNVTNSSVLITWMPPSPSRGPIESYTVRWNSSRGNGSNSTMNRSYFVTNLKPYMNYTFTVSASTMAGRGEWSKSVRIQTDIGVPTAPRNLQSLLASNTSLTVQWNCPEYPNAPVLVYNVTYHLHLRKDVSPSTETVRRPADQEIITYVIENLLPYSYYNISVYASSTVGTGPVSDDIIQQTEVGVPLPAKILLVKPTKSRIAVVRWTTEGAYPGPVDFSLEAWKFPGLCSRDAKKNIVAWVNGSHRADDWRQIHNTKVESLSPYGVYDFTILLKTTGTENVISSRVSDPIRTAPEAPSEPIDIQAQCTGSPTELKISWRPPKRPNGFIRSYRILYGIEKYNGSRLVHVDDMCQSQSYVLTGLRPEKRYLISISARVENVSEDGTSAKPTNVCTLPPGIPFLGDTSGLKAEGSGPESLELRWTRDAFSDYMGNIVQYAVFVGRVNSLGNATSGKWARLGPPWFNFSSGSTDFYQVTPPGWNPFQNDVDPLDCRISFELHNEVNRTVVRCTIGLDKNCPENETYCNGPLKPDTQYELKIRAFTGGGFTETDPIHARSKPVPKPSVAGKVAAVVIVLFLIVILAGGGYVMKKKGHLNTIIVHIQSHFNSKEEPAKREDPPMQMEECNIPKPIKTKDFAEHVKIMMSDSHLKFSMEFEKLKNESPRLPCTVAEMEENRAKNRWMNIFPFDHSRVKLLPLCDEPGSDFINANYIPGYSSPREYIATQGPLPHVLDDFWRMIWEQSVNMIVMLTQCVERGKKKCEKYWPDSGETAYHGDLRITTVSVSMLSSYIIRIFHVQLGSYERMVKQMHFTHWPDFGCPESPEDLINFVNAVREHLPRVAPGPILVHCSAGVGRTGTFITVDRLMLQLRNARYTGEDTVDVYGTVLELRQHRTNMVQTEDQYIYIHLCVRQLIEDRDKPRDTGSQENIYSNIEIERESVRSIKPTAPELPL